MTSRAVVIALVAVTLSTLLGSGYRASAAPSESFGSASGSWLMAGDSFSSGQGLDDNAGQCARSVSAYPEVAFDNIGYENSNFENRWTFDTVACTSDAIDNFRLQTAEASLHFNSASFDTATLPPRCLAQLSIVTGKDYADSITRGDKHFARWTAGGCSGPKPRYDIITMTFGGDNIEQGFGGVIEGCLEGPLVGAWNDIANVQPLPRLWPSCPSYDQLRSDIQRLSQRDEVTYGVDSKGHPRKVSYGDFVSAVANDYLTPRGRLFVIGYPKLFAPSDDWPWYDFACDGMEYHKADMFGDLSHYLDTIIKNQVGMARAHDNRIRYLSMLDSFDGHELCGKKGDWLNGIILTGTSRTQSFHPNQAGNDAEGTIVSEKILADPPSTSNRTAASGDLTSLREFLSATDLFPAGHHAGAVTSARISKNGLWANASVQPVPNDIESLGVLANWVAGHWKVVDSGCCDTRLGCAARVPSDILDELFYRGYQAAACSQEATRPAGLDATILHGADSGAGETIVWEKYANSDRTWALVEIGPLSPLNDDDNPFLYNFKNGRWQYVANGFNGGACAPNVPVTIRHDLGIGDCP